MKKNYIEQIVDNICFAIDTNRKIEIRFFLNKNDRNYMFTEIYPLEVEQEENFIFVYADASSFGIDLSNVEDCGEDGYYCHGDNSTFVLNF